MPERCPVIFPTKVQGIPCQCEIVNHTPYVPARIYGPIELCHPAEGGETELQLLDRKGYQAQWLAKKLTPDDIARLEEEAHIYIQGQEREAFPDSEFG